MGNCGSASQAHSRVRDDYSTAGSSPKKTNKKNNNSKKSGAVSKNKNYPPKVQAKPTDVTNIETTKKQSKKYAVMMSPDPTDSSTADVDHSSSVATMPLSPLSPESAGGTLASSPYFTSNRKEPRLQNGNSYIRKDANLTIDTNYGSSPLLKEQPYFPTQQTHASPTSGIYYTMPSQELNSGLGSQQSQLRRKSPRKHRHSHHQPAGRALQGRLQRAQKMQRVLSTSDSHQSVSSSTLDCMSSGEESSTTSSLNRKYNRTMSSKYSTLSNVSADGTFASSHSLNHDEYEATLSNAAVWAEIELNDTVLCTSLSRTKASLSKSVPPIHIAVGTSSGLIHIQELLNGDDLTLGTSSIGGTNGIVNIDQSYPRKLGRDIKTKVSGKVRSIDFSTDGKCLAVGGDSGICTIFRLEYALLHADGFVLGDEEHLVKVERIVEIHRIDRIYAVQFSPDGTYLAIGGFDGTVGIFSMKHISAAATHNKTSTAAQIEPITEIPREGLILTIDWSPDSRYLAIGGSDKSCAIVNTSASWKVFKEIRRTTAVQSVQWYPGTGRYLAIGSSDVAIVVGRDTFATITEIELRDDVRTDGSPTSKDKQRSVYRTNAICWSPNGSYFVICGSNRKCTIVETQSFTIVHEMIRAGNITCAVWGQQNQISAGVPRRYLAIGGEDKKVVILKAGIEVNPGTSSLADDYSYSAASSYFSTRGDWVLKEDEFSDMENILEVPAENTERKKVKEKVKKAHVAVENNEPGSGDNANGDGIILSVTFSKGSKTKPSIYFAYSADNGLVTIRHVQDWKMVAEIQFPQAIQSLSFSNGSPNQYLALGGIDSNVYVSDTTANFSIIARILLTAPVTSVTFSKNNERLAAGSQDGTFAFLDPLNNFEYCGEIEMNCNDENDDGDSSHPSAAAVLAVDWCSKNMAIGREDGIVTIYDAKKVVEDDFTPVTSIARKGAVTSLAFGVSSRFLAVAGADCTIGIYSSKGLWVLCHQVKMDSLVSAVRWSPVGRYLSCGSANGQMKVIDTIFWADVEEAAESVAANSSSSQGHSNNAISFLSFSQDGKLLALARSDIGTVVLNTSTNWTVDFQIANNHPSDTSGAKDISKLDTAQIEESSLSSSGDDRRQVTPGTELQRHRFKESHEVSFSDDDYYPHSYYNVDSGHKPCEV